MATAANDTAELAPLTFAAAKLRLMARDIQRDIARLEGTAEELLAIADQLDAHAGTREKP